MNRVQIVTIKMVKEKSLLYETTRINSPSDANEIAQKFLEGADREHFVVMCLDTKHKVNALNTVSVGTLNSSQVHPREVFKPAILANSAAIILVHNHPSGDPTPSQEDIAVTKRLTEAGQVLGIQVYDHIILGDGQYVSLNEKGVI